MARVGLTIKGFQELEKLLQAKPLEQRLRSQVKKSNKLIGMIARDAIIEAIDRKVAPPGMENPSEYPNQPLTTAMKGHTTPLVGKAPASLRGSITYRVEKWDRVYVGVLRRRSKPGGDGQPDDVINVGVIVHEGATVPVTPKMRAYMARQGFPLSPSTTKIRIPGRPFLRSATTKKLEDQYREIWSMAVQAALSGKG